MDRSRWSACLVAVCLTWVPLTASAQVSGPVVPGPLLLEVSLDSTYFDGCDPGTACLFVFCGQFEGTLALHHVGFDGVFDNYDVTMVDWTLFRSGCPADVNVPPAPVTGTGTFQIDRALVRSQQMVLDLSTPFGPDITVNSGLVVPTVPFPAFEGFVLNSHPTSEIFTLHAQPVTSDVFVRGDANADGSFNVADPVFTLDVLFGSGPSVPPCPDAIDANDDGLTNIADPVAMLAALFTMGASPPADPYPNCGVDPTPDGLSCPTFLPCP